MKSQSLDDNEVVWVIIYTFLAFLMLLIAVVLFIYFSRKKILLQRMEHKDAKIQHQSMLMQTMIDTQEKERKRIAQDLHDDISSKINVLSLNCKMINEGVVHENQLQKISSEMIGMTEELLDSTRRITHDLMPPVLDNIGLDAAIIELCKNFSNSSDIIINYENEIGELIFDEINKDKHVHLFRIIQELINNSIRHGQATRIDLSIEKKGENVILSYKDNGKGFEQNELSQIKGIGMKNITTRIDFMSAKFYLESKIGKGVSILIKL
ncbi:MAG: ATP-binding protein [Brumimicrobium sp.]